MTINDVGFFGKMIGRLTKIRQNIAKFDAYIKKKIRHACKNKWAKKLDVIYGWPPNESWNTYLHIVLCERAPTPGSLRLARALPTSHCVTPSLIRLCLKRSANASNSLRIKIEIENQNGDFSILFPE